MPKQLDFSGQAEPVAAAAKPLDFSAYAAPAAVDPQAVAAFRAQHASDVPLPPSLDTATGTGSTPNLFQRASNVSAGAGDALTASLIRVPHVLNLASGGLNSLLGLTDNADADFARAQQVQSEADQYQRSAQEVSPNGAIAGNILGIVPKLVAPEVLAVDALSHGSDLGTRAINAGVSVPRAEALMAEGNVAGLAQNLLPGNLAGNILTRALSGAAINAGTQAAEQGIEHATAPEVVDAPTLKEAATAGGIGAIIAAALGHGAGRVSELGGEQLVADPVPLGLPRGADYSAKAEPIRPAPVDLGGNVTVNAQGEAATTQQGAAAFADALDALRGRTTPALGEPVVAVDAAGRAATTADQNAAMQPAPPVAPDPLGLTERQRQLVANDPRAAREGAPIQPKALPAPVVTVDRAGQAQTTSQFQQAIQRQQQAAAERKALGITPDIERTQGTRWAQRDQAAREEADRQAKLAELDKAIATQEKANLPARGRNAKPDETVDDALTFLAKKGGLDRRTFVKEGIDPAVARAPQNLTRGGAGRPLFRAQGSGGMTLDQVAETLWQHGYLPDADNNAALDLIHAGVNQDAPTYSIHRQDQGDLLALQQAKQDAEQAPPANYADVPFSFAGERAMTADRRALEQAQQMEAMGRDSVPDRFGNQPGSPEDTHVATGWHRGVDGKWRFEIDDSQAIVDADGLRIDRQRGVPSELGQILQHPALMEAYPDLAKVKVKINPAMSGIGAYHGASNSIEIRPPSEYAKNGDGSLKSVLLHEIQHAIQNHEGFARGGNATEARKMPEFEQTLRQHMQQHDGELPPWDQVKPDHPAAVKAAREVYRRLAGEVEARNTQRRMNMDAGERRAVPPSETADVPRDKQIVRFNADRAERSGPDDQDARAIAKYNAKLSEYIGQPVRFSAATNVPDAARRALAAFDDAFGSRTIVVRNETPDVLDFNGVTLRDGVRLVDENATSPLLTVAGHEMVHQLRKDAPDLYAELEAEVRRQGRLDDYGADLNARARASGESRDVDPRLVAEELTADATGDALSDPEFIERMAKQNPSLFRRLAQRLMNFFDSLTRKLRDLGSSKYLDDVEAFRTKLADVLERYGKRQAEGVREPMAASEEAGALSRKPSTDQMQTPEFKRWFGDSKVVDANGKPLVVYHGTTADFEAFSNEFVGEGNGLSDLGDGFYFTDRPDAASQYAKGDGGQVMPVYLAMKNPATNEVLSHDDVQEAMDDGMGFTSVQEVLEEKGFDGIIYTHKDGAKEYVVFRPEQVKSAIGNRGTFDPNEPSILFSRKPPPSESEYLQDIPSRRPGESQAAYLRRITRKNGEEIKAATALVKQQRRLGRYALRGMMATQARQAAIADAALSQARKTFDKTPQVINFASVHQWETGQPITDPDFRDFVGKMQAGFDQRIAEIHRLAPGALQSLIENYMPHLYEDSGKALKWYQNALGKRPLQGDRSFLKQREWPTLKDAMASGLKPISPNPVDWVMMKYHQMDKFIGLLRLKEEFARRGWLMKIDAGQRVPEGFARVDDPAFQIAGGLQGSYVVPEMIAKDINNYLAPGLSKYGAWRSIRAVQNAMVSWNLGWSAFHAGFTSIDNAVTHGAVGLQRLLDGDIHGGLMALVKAVPTMVLSPFEGARLNREWRNKGLSRLEKLTTKAPVVDKFIFGNSMGDPHVAALLDLLEQGGARMKMGTSTAEYNNALPQVMRTIRQLQAPGAMQDALQALTRRVKAAPARTLAETGWGSLKAAGKAISAIGEVGSFLIHHVLVPNQKMAARVTLLKFELDQYAKKLGKERGDYAGILSVMNPAVAKQLASDVVDKVDFRLGQMTYDNFFYPKIAREIAQLLVMAPGWQAGAFQTMTGGLKDIGRLVTPEKLIGPLDKAGNITDATRPRVTNNLANLAMLFLMVGGGNALYQWLVSGIEPDEAKDLVAPRTGRKNADDSDERLVAPSYMKDHYEFFHHPLQMASHKLHPAWRLMWELGHNEDYFGNMIRDPHHPLAKQAKELSGYLLKSMLPFTATNASKLKENGATAGDYAANFVGITPASASLTRTPFQAFVAKGGARGWDGPARTPAQAEYSDRMRNAENAMRTGQTPKLDGLTPKDVANLQRRVRTPKPEMQFDRLSLADKIDAYDMATPDERRRYHLDDVLNRTDPRRSIAFRRLPAEEQQALLDDLARIRRNRGADSQ